MTAQEIAAICAEKAIDPRSITVKEIGAPPSTKAARRAAFGKAEGVLFIVSTHSKTKEWLICEGFNHRGLVGADIYWKSF
ncbi:MAG: hypothetical protein HN341_19830 [Verrucomicrobia bacterium]|jgi:hypothetical protein|nr:hypothetical protein [Verrucomicrobiota bacterium]